MHTASFLFDFKFQLDVLITSQLHSMIINVLWLLTSLGINMMQGQHGVVEEGGHGRLLLKDINGRFA